MSLPPRFLGLLHMEVFHQRLEQEHGANVITTSPTVPYSIEHTDGSREEIQNPSQVTPSLSTLPFPCSLAAVPACIPCSWSPAVHKYEDVHT